MSSFGVLKLPTEIGYSWLSNQYGLTIDNVVSYQLVLPTGLLTTVTATSNPNLFFALKVSGLSYIDDFYSSHFREGSTTTWVV